MALTAINAAVVVAGDPNERSAAAQDIDSQGKMPEKAATRYESTCVNTLHCC